ncbi:MAG: hypothetical protein OXR64_00965, partial [Chloroflexota bacterium]|nr:hypothetical protein [Chloroflexota bacterium]
APNQQQGFGQVVIAIRKPHVSLATAPPSTSTPKPNKAAQSESNHLPTDRPIVLRFQFRRATLYGFEVIP